MSKKPRVVQDSNGFDITQTDSKSWHLNLF